MADLVLTPAQVKHLTSDLVRGTCGVTIAPGDVIYVDPADGLVKLADGNLTGEPHTADGIAVNGGAVGQPVDYIRTGVLQLSTGAAVGVVGSPVILSATAGKMAPHTDYATGMWWNHVGYLDSTGKKLTVAIVSADTVKP